jgi:hypothetical protein
LLEVLQVVEDVPIIPLTGVGIKSHVHVHIYPPSTQPRSDRVVNFEVEQKLHSKLRTSCKLIIRIYIAKLSPKIRL